MYCLLWCVCFSSEDFQMGFWVRNGNTSPLSFRYLTRETLAVKELLKILVVPKYIQDRRVCTCVCVSQGGCQIQFSILSQQTPFDFKEAFMSCASCTSSSQQTHNLFACLSNKKQEWSIAKHWSMKSKPLFYPCFSFWVTDGLLCQYTLTAQSGGRGEREVL